MSALATLAASLALTSGAPEKVVLPGVLDLPVTAGEKTGTGCVIGDDTIPRTATSDCVSMPARTLDRDMLGYIQTLRSQGWTQAGGAAIQIWLERKRPEGDCERLDVSAVADFSLPRAEMLKGQGAAVFDYKPQAPCRAVGK